MNANTAYLDVAEIEPARDDPKTPTVTLGFIPLTDCAVLAVARERGFATREGINLQLFREVSWANIRDRVALGHFHGAQMLAGMPIAAALGINQIATPMIVPFCLNRNGNAISVANDIYVDMERLGDLHQEKGPTAAGQALARVIAERKSAGRPPLTFGMVYPFSCHNYELRYWMAACGIDPDADVRLVVIPPPLMVDSLRDGYIDGFCVGEPWNTLGVEAGLSHIIAGKAELWRYGIEKVLGVSATWAAENADVLTALIRALDRAAAWADNPQNRDALTALLARPEYLDLPQSLIARALSGDLIISPNREDQIFSDFLVLHRDGANCPSVGQALWIYSQMVRWHQVTPHPDDQDAVRSAFRPDIYTAALAGEAWSAEPPSPGASLTTGDESLFFDGHRFNPADIADYLGQLSVR